MTIHDSKSLLGLVMLNEGTKLPGLLEELRAHLNKYLRVPFQIMHSERLDRFNVVPAEVQRMRYRLPLPKCMSSMPAAATGQWGLHCSISRRSTARIYHWRRWPPSYI